MHNWWKLSVADSLAELKTDASTGLSNQEVERRLEKHGPNALVEGRIKSPWRILWEQLTSVMVVILIVAAVVSAFLGERADALVIAVIVILNLSAGDLIICLVLSTTVFWAVELEKLRSRRRASKQTTA